MPPHKTWKPQYDGVEFRLPSHAALDQAFAKAKQLVANGENLQIPKAVVPPKGRRCLNAGKRKKTFYEGGPAARSKRSYTCSLCGIAGHVKTSCVFRQVFQGTAQAADEAASSADEAAS